MKHYQEVIYYVQGTHCSSCELIIERKLIDMPGIEKVSVSNKSVQITYSGDKPGRDQLDKIFIAEGYTFHEKAGESLVKHEPFSWVILFFAVILGLLIYLLIQKTGLKSLIRVDAKSSLPSLYLFGLMAGLSTCAALIGGIILSLSKIWAVNDRASESLTEKIRPHLLFNAGRLLSYTTFGALLGGLGGFLRFSPTLSAVIIIAVALFMLVNAAQLFGVRGFDRLYIATPKSLNKLTTNSKNFKGSFMTMVLGSLTFLLPCGFTLTAQSLALVSGSALQGALVMLAFALGTLIPLLIIGIGSRALFANKKWANHFGHIAGIMLLVFALFNINSGLTVLGVRPSWPKAKPTQENQPSTSGEIQVIKMDAGARGYKPNYFKVKAGKVVRWEIFDSGTSGCTNAIISKDLFSGEIELSRGKTAIKEFTPTKPGRYQFSCWMGMVSGTIEVIN